MDISNTISVDDLYMILPSNGCPLTQPENHGSSYIIDWETPISLKGKWEAALTEFSVANILSVSKEPSTIKIVSVRNRKETISIIVGPKILVLATATPEGFWMSQEPTGYVKFNYTTDFKLIFDSPLDAKNLGFNDPVIESTDNVLITPNLPNTTKLYADLNFYKSKQIEKNPGDSEEAIILYFKVQFPKLKQYYDMISFQEPLAFDTPQLLCSFIIGHCPTIFKQLQVDQNGYIFFKLKPEIDSITFSPIIKNILGFEKSTFINTGIHKAENKTYREKTTNLMYIYSSLVDPIMVGGVYVPLLRSIWVDSKNGDMVHKNVKNKMYLPVSSTSINNIEIQIRNDAGELISFPYGSKTTLTLHLQRYG